MSFQNKMTPEQKSVMETYMKQNPLTAKYTNRSRQERIRQNHLWDKLVGKLNLIGPPVRNRSEWRKTWTCLKYKTKVKKTTGDEEEESELSTDNSDQKEGSTVKSEVNTDPEVPESTADTTHLSINPRKRMRNYFDCFNESVLSLPEHLQLKCRNEIFTVISRYEEIAREQ